MSDTDSKPSLLAILSSNDYADLTINCGTKAFPVHKAVVCPQSAFFAAACNSGFKEAQSREVNLVDDDPEAVRRMISYFYTQDDDPSQNYPEAPVVTDDEYCDALEDVRVYVLADKYDIPGLKQLAKNHFSEWVESNWSSEQFPDVVRELCRGSVHQDLQDVIAEVIAENAETALEQETLVGAMVSSGELVMDVLRRVLQRHSEEMSSETETQTKLNSRIEGMRQEIRRNNDALEWTKRDMGRLKISLDNE